jgi:hypothetical protein
MDASKEQIQKVLAALEDNHYTWRTIKGVSKNTGLNSEQVENVLKAIRSRILQKSSRYGETLYTTSEHYLDSEAGRIRPEQSLSLAPWQYSKLLRIRQLLSGFLLLIVAVWVWRAAFAAVEGLPLSHDPIRILLVVLAGVVTPTIFATFLYHCREDSPQSLQGER